jgi:D-tyrosyl-tRNA(Tyr) deacylase
VKLLLQRVQSAAVTVAGVTQGEIGPGILVLVGFEPNDTQQTLQQGLQKVLKLRMFADAQGRMNLDVGQVAGGLLMVSQFTLAADTHKGHRPGFSTAASPEQAAELFDQWVALAQQHYPKVATGLFGADMQVHLVNDGPVTFWLEF